MKAILLPVTAVKNVPRKDEVKNENVYQLLLYKSAATLTADAYSCSSITAAAANSIRAAVDYMGIAPSSLGIMVDRWQFSIKPGRHVLPGFSNYPPRSEHTAVRAGPHNGDAGRVADASRGSGARDEQEAYVLSADCAKTLTWHDYSEMMSYISTSRPRPGASALSGRIREAGR